MPNWKKVIVSGSDAALNSLNVTAQFTASGLNYPNADGAAGQVVITDGAGTLSFSNVENTTITIKNVSSGTIQKGTPCYITGSGTSGNLAGVWPADASNPLRMPAGVIAGEDLIAGAEGVGLLNGFINGVDTSAFNSGDSVYVKAGGGYTNVRPTGSSVYVQKLGNVEKSAINGSGVVNGPGYYNDLPNVQSGFTWVGNSNGVAVAIATSSIQNVVSSSYATQAGNSSTIDISSFSSPVESYLLMSNVVATTGVGIGGDSDLRYNSSTNRLTVPNISATTITGSLLGTASFASTASYVNPLNQTVIVTGSLAVTGSTSLIGSSTANAGTYTFVASSVGDSGIRIDNSINGYTSINWLSNSVGFGLMAGGGLFAKISNAAGLHIGQSPTSTYIAPLAVTSHGTTTGTTFLARNSAGTNILKVVDNGRIGINNANPIASLDVVGTTKISGSFNTAASGSILTVIGSGSAQPIFTIQGSQGELFSVTDSLSGSLYSVNDISGLPILEVFSDNTILMGNYQDPMLITTTKLVTTASGAFTLYALPTASYDTAFFEYSIKSGSNARAGSIMAIQSGTSVNFTETTTTDFGSTSGFGFTVQVSGANMSLTGSATTSGWTIKTIVRSI